jgi:hypothetical protein
MKINYFSKPWPFLSTKKKTVWKTEPNPVKQQSIPFHVRTVYYFKKENQLIPLDVLHENRN